MGLRMGGIDGRLGRFRVSEVDLLVSGCQT